MPQLIIIGVALVIVAIVARGGFRLLFGIAAGIVLAAGLLIGLLISWGSNAHEQREAEHEAVQESFSAEAMDAAEAAAMEYLESCMESVEPVTCDGAAQAAFAPLDELDYDLYPTVWSEPELGEGEVFEDGDGLEVYFPASLHSSVTVIPRNDWEPMPDGPDERDVDFEVIVTMDGEKAELVRAIG